METVGSRDLTSSSYGKADLLFENNKGMVIHDKNQKVVAVDQVYKDKDILKAVMVNYAITNRFNYRTERSNAISYTLVCVSGECDWKFRASSVGFDYCRPIVVVDGSHLKTSYNGTFVSASTLDGAGNILPLAYGVIDSENDRSWTWFFERFRETYEIRGNMCIVSDRHESINKAVCRIYPEVAHYACIWHLWGNAYTQDDFDEFMGKVQKVDMGVAEYLESTGRDKWARLYASVNRGWTMTSNIAECINRHLLAARGLPMYDFLEESEKWNIHFNACYNVFDKLVLVLICGVSTHYMNVYLVSMNNEIPCPHAWTVIKKKNLVANDYCSDLVKPETVLKTHDVPVDPLPDERELNIPKYILEDVILPPRYKRLSGRPKKRRDKPLSELLFGKNRHACSTCGQLGHNRRSCNFEPLRK
ncbi:uncharacterized protein LOC132643896 [Lycium barbarum]|uniref:uncharacterized protein LOC132643896 n=1 Tax=Lycium barbarum TaxID=112863 RepID=UPI00293E7521|nr:uncharacterized protein LOC132643896 [Lycium barbarum]